MDQIKVIETGNYMELVELFQKSGLEIHIEEGKPPAMITCWKSIDEDGILIGGVSIEQKNGYFTVGDIAVRDDYRKRDIGTLMLKTAVERIKYLGGGTIYIVAKAPKFFEKHDFTYLTSEETPDIFNCKDCNQRGRSCFPEFMKAIV